jgi:hypothetical protein
MELQSKWILFFGLCVFPIPVTLLSAGVGMEESKQVAFCASCHQPMGPFVEDMRAPGSEDLAEDLAAVHYKNWLIRRDHCWTCHSDYGIAGTARASSSGRATPATASTLSRAARSRSSATTLRRGRWCSRVSARAPTSGR